MGSLKKGFRKTPRLREEVGEGQRAKVEENETERDMMKNLFKFPCQRAPNPPESAEPCLSRSR